MGMRPPRRPLEARGELPHLPTDLALPGITQTPLRASVTTASRKPSGAPLPKVGSAAAST